VTSLPNEDAAPSLGVGRGALEHEAAGGLLRADLFDRFLEYRGLTRGVRASPSVVARYAAGTFFWGSMNGIVAVVPVRSPSSAWTSSRFAGSANPIGTHT
jgi:hypothetical protein